MMNETGNDQWFVIRRHGAFFRPEAAGYTTHLAAAGLYTREQADKYADAEGVQIQPLSDWRGEAQAIIAGAQRLSAALAWCPSIESEIAVLNQGSVG